MRGVRVRFTTKWDSNRVRYAAIRIIPGPQSTLLDDAVPLASDGET